MVPLLKEYQYTMLSRYADLSVLQVCFKCRGVCEP